MEWKVKKYIFEEFANRMFVISFVHLHYLYQK